MLLIHISYLFNTVVFNSQMSFLYSSLINNSNFVTIFLYFHVLVMEHLFIYRLSLNDIVRILYCYFFFQNITFILQMKCLNEFMKYLLITQIFQFVNFQIINICAICLYQLTKTMNFLLFGFS